MKWREWIILLMGGLFLHGPFLQASGDECSLLLQKKRESAKRRIAVFGTPPAAHSRMAEDFLLFDFGLVYDGAGKGVMARIAQALRMEGGEALGVRLREQSGREKPIADLDTLYIEKSMHNRKKRLFKVADAFLVFPGGLGTLDEFIEALTWVQLDFHSKPIYVVNHEGFYDDIIKHIEHARKKNFLHNFDPFRHVFFMPDTRAALKRLDRQLPTAGTPSSPEKKPAVFVSQEDPSYIHIPQYKDLPATLDPQKNRVAVFCGATCGNDPGNVRMMESFGRELARQNVGLVYGGGSRGLMGAVARETLAQGGEVIGVSIPDFIIRENVKADDSFLYVEKSIHARKRRMYITADAFFIMPGGLGTLDEFFEIATWRRLGFHQKPIYLINHKNFYRHLIAHLSRVEKNLEDAGIFIAQGPHQALRHFLLEVPFEFSQPLSVSIKTLQDFGDP